MTKKKAKTPLTKNQKANLRRKWRRWINRLVRDMAELLTSNEILKEVCRIVAKNEQIKSPATLHNWMRKSVIDQIGTGIRRLTDKDKRSISLYRLIEDISENNEAITREWYVSTYPKWMKEQGLADRGFDIFGKKGDSYLSLPKLKKDKATLENGTIQARKYVNKWVAHCDLNRRRVKRVTYGDIWNALESLDNLCCKYNLLLTRGSMNTCMPVIGSAWKQVLRHAWII